MLKGDAVINTITIIGIAAIGALMFTKVPGMIDDIKIIMSKTSVIGKAAELADQLTLSMSSPDEIKIIYKLPEEVSYTVFIKDGYVNVSTDKDWAVSKTLSGICFKETCPEDHPVLLQHLCYKVLEECVPPDDPACLTDPVAFVCKPDSVKTLMITKSGIEKVE